MAITAALLPSLSNQAMNAKRPMVAGILPSRFTTCQSFSYQHIGLVKPMLTGRAPETMPQSSTEPSALVTMADNSPEYLIVDSNMRGDNLACIYDLWIL